MDSRPLISIVTPSFNQGEFLRETLQSLVAQDYPRLEVIIQDGGSTDNSLPVAREFAAKFPEMFQVHAEPDHGQAHAINLGLRKARGQILGFLNSDDTLLPGCLASVAREVNLEQGRFVVFGRCLFTGEGMPYVGVEHPAEFRGHFEQLAIWKRGFNTLPQPSVFWHRRVWEECGGLDESESHVLDYDLFCRYSRRFRFHKVDELWSTYRLHAASKSAQRTEAEVLALSVAVSRRHWPAWWHPRRWRLAWSHWLHDRHAHERARHHARRAEQAFAANQLGLATLECVRTLALSPRMAWHRLLQPLLAGRGLHWLEKLFLRPEGKPEEFTGRYPDGWIGPVYLRTLIVPGDAECLRLKMQHNPQTDGAHAEIRVEARVDDQVVLTRDVSQPGPFDLEIDLQPCRNRACRLELRTRPHFIPSTFHGTEDHRRLTALLFDVAIELTP